jgi:hypothetical protein
MDMTFKRFLQVYSPAANYMKDGKLPFKEDRYDCYVDTFKSRQG